MINLKELFSFIKVAKFIENYTGLNPNGGVKHRLSGIPTNQKNKTTSLTDEDKKEIKTGLKKFAGEVNEIADKI